MVSSSDLRRLAAVVDPLAEAGASDAEAVRAIMGHLRLPAEGTLRMTVKAHEEVDALLRASIRDADRVTQEEQMSPERRQTLYRVMEMVEAARVRIQDVEHRKWWPR